MSMRLVEGFDLNGTAKWDTTGGSITIGSYGGTNSSARLQTEEAFVQRTFDNQASWIVGLRFKKTRHFEDSSTMIILSDSGTQQIALGITDSGEIFVVCPAGTYTDTFVLENDTWYYVELKTTIHNTAGSFEARLNGETRLEESGIDTQANSNAYANRVRIRGAVDSLNTNYTYFDDIYIADGQTGTGEVSDFVGDSKVVVLLPTADGAVKNFTPLSGTDNFAMIDEAAQDGDTSYVEAPDDGDVDTYGFADLPAGATSVVAVQLVTVAKKDDAGVRAFKNVVRHGGVNYPGGEHFLGAGYQTFFDVFDANPGTNAEWTINNVNTDDEFGFEITT